MKTETINRRKPSDFMHEIKDTRHEDTLRSCPFCNGEAKIEAYERIYYVRCQKCGAQTWNTQATSEELARLQWNIRLGR